MVKIINIPPKNFTKHIFSQFLCCPSSGSSIYLRFIATEVVNNCNIIFPTANRIIICLDILLLIADLFYREDLIGLILTSSAQGYRFNLKIYFLFEMFNNVPL